jgi:hypothetical protein
MAKVTCGVKRVGDSYLGEKAQGQFCLVKMRVKNVGKDPRQHAQNHGALRCVQKGEA